MKKSTSVQFWNIGIHSYICDGFLCFSVKRVRQITFRCCLWWTLKMSVDLNVQRSLWFKLNLESYEDYHMSSWDVFKSSQNVMWNHSWNLDVKQLIDFINKEAAPTRTGWWTLSHCRKILCTFLVCFAHKSPLNALHYSFSINSIKIIWMKPQDAFCACQIQKNGIYTKPLSSDCRRKQVKK